MAKVIAIGNNKGGIGKTTTAANLATGLARKGKRVLAIDNDPQGHLSKSLGVESPASLEYTLDDVMKNLVNDIDIEPGDGIIKTTEGVDLMPTNLKYSGMELVLFSAMNREQILKDYVTMMRPFYDYIIDDYVMKASGELTLNLVFDKEWKIDTTDGEDSFVAVEKIESVHNVTNDELIDEILLYELTYGGAEDDMFSYYSTEQVISMSRGSISDFVVNSDESTSKGTVKTYNCSFLLTKQNVVFDVNAIITYEYVNIGGWSLDDISFVVSVASVDVGGDWIGTYNGTPDQGECVLSINTIDETGNITGIYSYYPYEQNNVFQPGSFYVSGSINTDNLCINLIPGEWIEKPQWSTLTMDISLQLIVEEATLYGSGHESSAIVLTRD